VLNVKRVRDTRSNQKFQDEVKVELQQVKDELQQMKQEMREEHIATRNTSLKGRYIAFYNCVLLINY